MRVTVYKKDENCTELGVVKVAHICMFSDIMETSIHFVSNEEQMKFMKICVDNYVLFKCQGTTVTLVPEPKNYQRVWLRFDS